MPNNIQPISIIVPTASGKTPFSALSASVLDDEIISGDSQHVHSVPGKTTRAETSSHFYNARGCPTRIAGTKFSQTMA